MAGYNDLISGNLDLGHPEWQVTLTQFQVIWIWVILNGSYIDSISSNQDLGHSEWQITLTYILNSEF